MPEFAECLSGSISVISQSFCNLIGKSWPLPATEHRIGGPYKTWHALILAQMNDGKKSVLEKLWKLRPSVGIWKASWKNTSILIDHSNR